MITAKAAVPSSLTDIVENGSSSITFAVLLIVRLRWRVWLDHSLTIFARGYAPKPARISHMLRLNSCRPATLLQIVLRSRLMFRL